MDFNVEEYYELWEHPFSPGDSEGFTEKEVETLNYLAFRMAGEDEVLPEEWEGYLPEEWDGYLTFYRTRALKEYKRLKEEKIRKALRLSQKSKGYRELIESDGVEVATNKVLTSIRNAWRPDLIFAEGAHWFLLIRALWAKMADKDLLERYIVYNEDGTLLLQVNPSECLMFSPVSGILLPYGVFRGREELDNLLQDKALYYIEGDFRGWV